MVAQYIYDETDNFPTNEIDSPVNITIVNATGSSIIDIVSTLSGNFSYLEGVSIYCGRDSLLSNHIAVEGYGKFKS